MRSVIIVPMITRGRTIGALTLRERQLRPPLRRAGRGAGPGAGRGAARPRSTTPGSTPSARTSRAPSRRACCPWSCRTSPAWRPPHASGRPARATRSGGDFYDMFETGNRGWTVVMGDVCGKGPDAAAVTALARYTLRAAAMREHLPSRSLAVLNEALLRQRDDRRFCTVAYAYIEKLDRRRARGSGLRRASAPAAAARRRHRRDRSECPGRCWAWSPTPTSRTARSRSSRATRSSSTPTA